MDSPLASVYCQLAASRPIAYLEQNFCLQNIYKAVEEHLQKPKQLSWRVKKYIWQIEVGQMAKTSDCVLFVLVEVQTGFASELSVTIITLISHEQVG